MQTELTRTELEDLFSDLARTRLAVIGDFCLDAYWFIDLSVSEMSIETGLPTQPVAKQRYSLGGAGNVVNNLVDLGVGSVHAVGAIGDDPWGREIVALLNAKGVNTSGILCQEKHWDTLTYTKPHVGDVEQGRIDFGDFNALSDETAASLLTHLEDLLSAIDVIIVNQQVRQGIHTPALRERLANLMHHHAEKVFIVDSRHYSENYPGACLKVNEHEAARLSGRARRKEDPIQKEEMVQAAHTLFARLNRPVFITRGGHGCLVRDWQGLCEVPAIDVPPPIDTVGAGDSMLAGIAAALAAGRDSRTAATLGSLVAAVTIQKLRQTGTATPEELLALVADS